MAVLVVLWVQTPSGMDLLGRAGLVTTPKPFLELYFSDPGSHPQSVTPGESVPVSFVMKGNAGTFAEVDWRIDTIDQSGSQTAASGAEAMPEGESRTIVRDVAISCAGATAQEPRTEVRVSVVEPALQILFWVSCVPAGA